MLKNDYSVGRTLLFLQETHDICVNLISVFFQCVIFRVYPLYSNIFHLLIVTDLSQQPGILIFVISKHIKYHCSDFTTSKRLQDMHMNMISKSQHPSNNNIFIVYELFLTESTLRCKHNVSACSRNYIHFNIWKLLYAYHIYKLWMLDRRRWVHL